MKVKEMTIRIGDVAPDFVAQTTHGVIEFHEWLDNSWAVFVSHPKDFTPICTTELGMMASMQSQFDSRGVKLIGHSIDPVSEHLRWMGDIAETQGASIQFPIIGDEFLEVAKLYEMLPESALPGVRSIADNATVRITFIVNPEKKICCISHYPMSVGRNFNEVLRMLDSLQLTVKCKVATPVNWVPGGDVVIPPSISDEAAKEMFPNGWESPRPYLRMMSCPR